MLLGRWLCARGSITLNALYLFVIFNVTGALLKINGHFLVKPDMKTQPNGIITWSINLQKSTYLKFRYQKVYYSNSDFLLVHVSILQLQSITAYFMEQIK